MIRSPIFSNYTAIFIGFLLIGIWAGTISIFNKSPFQNDLTQFFPDQQSLETKYLKHRVSPSESTSWLMLAFSVESTHIGQQSTRLKNQLLEIPGVKQVLNGSETFESPHQQNPLPDLYPYRYLLTDFKLPQLKHNIEQRWEEYQHGFILDKHWLLSDPSYQWGIYLNKLKPASNLDKVQGVWVTPKSVSTGLFRTALFLIESEQNPQTIFAINKQLKNLSTLNNYQLSGASWIALQAESDIKQAVNWITAAATAMVIISLFIAFRSIKLIFLCSIPLVAAFAIGILSTISLFGNMQLITLALGAVLLGVAIDYPIHTIAAFQLKDSSIINKIWPTIRLGGLTSAFGFLMLLWINIEGLKQIAVFASTGLLGALLFTYLLKAHLINHYRIAIDSTDNKTAHNLRSINTTNLSIFLITGLLIICTVISLKPIKWQDDIASLSPVSSDLIETDRELRTLFQYQEAGKQLLLSANAIESLLQQQEELIPKLEKLKQNGVLQQYKLLAQLLPSQALQQERQTSLGYHSDLGTALIEATENTKFKPIHFNAFQTDIEYSQSLPLLNFQQFSQSNSISLEIVNQLIIPMDKKFIGVITLSGVVDDNQIYDFVENHKFDC
ncbi:MAG: hypothetical protein U9R28_08620, partial [Pseudomonadota bacterium]|nr:hypothetical protein [Pseudomonadota bacterium]